MGQQLHLSDCFVKGKETSSEMLQPIWAVSVIIVHPYTCRVLRKVMKRIRRCEWHIMMHEIRKRGGYVIPGNLDRVLHLDTYQEDIQLAKNLPM